MVYILRHKAGSGKLAIYDTADPQNPTDGPVDTPLSNLASIAFHSDLRYPAFLPAKIATGTTTIPAAAANDEPSGSIAIYSHGMGDTPVVFGKITGISASVGATYTLIDTPVAWCGSVPLIKFNTTSLWTQWAHLAADSTNVLLRYFGICAQGTGFPAIDVTWKIYVLDTTIDGTQFAGDATKPLLELLGDRITAGRRKFDTNNSYLRLNAGADQSILPRGETMEITGTPAYASNADNDWGWRFSVDGVTFVGGFGGSGSLVADFDEAGF